MKRKKTKNRAGFTLVELIIALAAACIVLSATAIILIFGQRSLSHEWQQVNLQRDASFAMQKMKQSIRSATKAQLENDGNGLRIYNDAGWIKFWCVSGQKNLLYQLKDEDPQTLLDGTVKSATFVIGGAANTVTIDLDVKSGDCETQITSTTMMRNFGT